MSIFKNKQPRSVEQITQNLTTIVSELEQSRNQFTGIVEENNREIAARKAQNSDIASELERNDRVAGKLRDLLG